MGGRERVQGPLFVDGGDIVLRLLLRAVFANDDAVGYLSERFEGDTKRFARRAVIETADEDLATVFRFELKSIGAIRGR